MLLAYDDHGKADVALPHDGGGAEAILAEFVQAGVDDAELAAQLQREGVQVFANSWHALLDCIAQKALQ